LSLAARIGHDSVVPTHWSGCCCPRNRSNDRQVLTSDPRQLLILDLDGNRLGNIEDLDIAADGTIETILTKDDEILGARLRTIGSFAAVCEAR
jgi:hypothetical protein